MRSFPKWVKITLSVVAAVLFLVAEFVNLKMAMATAKRSEIEQKARDRAQNPVHQRRARLVEDAQSFANKLHRIAPAWDLPTMRSDICAELAEYEKRFQLESQPGEKLKGFVWQLNNSPATSEILTNIATEVLRLADSVRQK